MSARDTLHTYAGTPRVLPDDMLDATLDAHRSEVLREAGAVADELIAAVPRTDADAFTKVDAYRMYSDRLHEIADGSTTAGESVQPAPDLHSRVHAALCRGNAPLLPLPKETVRVLVNRVTDAVAPLVAYRPVWDASLPPGGSVCSICGQPVESEPCTEHATAVATDLVIWHAAYPDDGQTLGHYTTRNAAMAHVHQLLADEENTTTDAVQARVMWRADDPTGPEATPTAWECWLIATERDDYEATGYVVSPVDVAAAYDPRPADRFPRLGSEAGEAL